MLEELARQGRQLGSEFQWEDVVTPVRRRRRLRTVGNWYNFLTSWKLQRRAGFLYVMVPLRKQGDPIPNSVCARTNDATHTHWERV